MTETSMTNTGHLIEKCKVAERKLSDLNDEISEKFKGNDFIVTDTPKIYNQRYGSTGMVLNGRKCVCINARMHSGVVYVEYEVYSKLCSGTIWGETTLPLEYCNWNTKGVKS
jgi:hypothetical protein